MSQIKESLEKRLVFDHLAKYSQFLMRSSFLDEVIEFNLQMGIDQKLSFLKYLNHLTEQELKEWWKRSFVEEFLVSFNTGNPIAFAKEITDRWKNGTVPFVPKEKVKISDVIIAYHNRKSTLYEFLPRYTQKPENYVAIIREIDEYFKCCEIYALEVYQEIQEESKQLNNEILNGILQNLPVIVTRINKDGTLVKSAGAGLKDIGLKEGDLIGKSLFQVYPDAHNIRKVYEERVASKFEGSVETQDGSVIFTNYFFPNEDGGVTGFSLNITSGKKLEEKLREREYFIQKVADSTPSHIYVFDYINNKSVYNNIELLSFLGYSQEQIKALGLEHLPNIIHPEDLAKIFDRQKKYLQATDEDIFYTEYRVKDAKGNYRWHAASTRVFKRNAEGKVWQVLGIAQDITERKEAQFELEKLNTELVIRNKELAYLKEKLEQSNKELEVRIQDRTEELLSKNKELLRINTDLDNFIYTASHDLKAPVSNIEGLVNTLLDVMTEKLEDEEKNIIEMIKLSIKRFKDTIRDLTDVSKIQKLQIDDLSEVVIADVVEDVKASIQNIIEENKAVISLNTESCPSLTFSKANFKSIIYNLLTNAIKYRKPDRLPVVEVNSYFQGKQAVLEVKDNGLGIPEEHMDKIFIMFKRMHDHVEGTGVGLYLVKRIIENAGGRIEVESKPGEGSVFKLYFQQPLN